MKVLFYFVLMVIIFIVMFAIVFLLFRSEVAVLAALCIAFFVLICIQSNTKEDKEKIRKELIRQDKQLEEYGTISYHDE